MRLRRRRPRLQKKCKSCWSENHAQAVIANVMHVIALSEKGMQTDNGFRRVFGVRSR